MHKDDTPKAGELYCGTRLDGVKQRYSRTEDWRVERQKRGYTRPPRGPEDKPVTVCIAAVCEQNIVVGVSDRMITAHDTQYEPDVFKHVNLTPHIAVMLADDLTIHLDILSNLFEEVSRLYLERLAAKQYLQVREVADLYARFYTQEFVKWAERRVLGRFKLDMESFVEKQEQLKPEFVTRLADEMAAYKLPDMEAIITGIDNYGGHVYLAYNGEVTPADVSAFAAIGSGYWHANSEAKAAGHTRLNPFVDTLFLAYRAKKRAEITPGVGKKTNMFIMNIERGFTVIPDKEIAWLDRVYSDLVKQQERLTKKAIAKVERYAEEVYARWEAAEREAAGGAGGGQDTPTDNQDGVRGGADAGEPEDPERGAGAAPDVR